MPNSVSRHIFANFHSLTKVTDWLLVRRLPALGPSALVGL